MKIGFIGIFTKTLNNFLTIKQQQYGKRCNGISYQINADNN